ncbi:hypothetical protein [Gordonia sp. (in: high G+C Gram-positive bacteria)]|uniref:hypothetical protein n=1 Tax=Gordonia sp. (in: high G+C Gram-positive bacteria) TaxID=84139 RepID=UPI0039E41C35
MKRLALILGMLAAAVAALMVVQPAMAGAQPPTISAGPVHVSLVNNDTAIAIKTTDGTINRVGNELQFMNSKGSVKGRVPLAQRIEGTTVPVEVNLASDAKSATLTPHQVALPRRPLPRPRNKGEAWGQLNYLWGQNAGCVGPPALVGAIIGFFVGFIIFGWITTPIGAAIGAYIGLDNCGRGRWGDRYHGETIRAFWRWWNMP